MSYHPAHQDEDVRDSDILLTASQSVEEEKHSTNLPRGTLVGKFKASWLPEIFGACISTAALIAIVTVLIKFDGGALPDWSYGITLNFFLSGMTILISLGISVPLSNGLGQLKWARLYDKRRDIHLDSIETLDAASRGPWGSLILLLLSRQGLMSVLGATTLILSVLVTASTQLIIRYPTQVLNDTSVATITKSVGYHNYDSGLNSYEGSTRPTLALLQSYFNGLFSSNSTDLISPLATVCPSGNCSWPTIETFAVCSRCTNLTSLITYTLDPDVDDPIRGSWSVPGQPVNLSRYDTRNIGSGSDLLYVFSNVTFGIFDILNVTMLGAHYMGDGIALTSPWALNCGLSFCKQNVETMTVSGTTTQNITSLIFNNTLTSSLNITAPPSYGGNLLTSMANVSAHTDIRNISFDTTSPFPISTDTGVLYAWSTFLPSSWIGSISISVDKGVVYTPVAEQWPLLRAIAGAAKPGGYDLDSPEFNNTETGADIPALFARIATSITNGLRTEVGSVSVAGQDSTTVRYVKIRWEWLSLPAIVVFLTWLFILGVVVVNNRSKATKWKSNSLAILVVGGKVGQQLSDVQDAETLIRAAKKIKMQMDDIGVAY